MTIRIVSVFLLVAFMSCQAVPIPTTISTQCPTTPFYSLGLCNVTCSSCIAGSPNQCTSCPPLLKLSGSQCVANSTLTNVTTYLTNDFITVSQLSKFVQLNQAFDLAQQNIMRLCSPNIYKFDMVGLFQDDVTIRTVIPFNQTVNYIQVRMNILTLFANSTVTMNINNNQVFLKLLNQPNYTFTTESPTATVRIVYLNLPVLTSDNAKNVIVTITSNPFLQAVETATIDIQVLSPASHPQLWAFSDFTVIYQQCGNCSTRQLNSFITIVGILIGITAAILVFFILLLLLLLKLQRLRRLNKFKHSEKQTEYVNDSTLQIRKALARINASADRFGLEEYVSSKKII